MFQLAYKIDKMGCFYRVFPGFFPTIPIDLEKIVFGNYDYIIAYNVTTAFKKGIFHYLENHKDSIMEPFPKYDISYVPIDDNGFFTVSEFSGHQNYESFFGSSDGSGLPDKYKDVKLINSIPTSLFFIYLLSSGFDLSHWELFTPGSKMDLIENKYGPLLR